MKAKEVYDPYLGDYVMRNYNSNGSGRRFFFMTLLSGAFLGISSVYHSEGIYIMAGVTFMLGVFWGLLYGKSYESETHHIYWKAEEKKRKELEALIAEYEDT